MLEVYNKNTFSRIFSYVKGNYIIFGIGMLCAGINGAIYPVFTIFLSKMLVTMFSQADVVK